MSKKRWKRRACMLPGEVFGVIYGTSLGVTSDAFVVVDRTTEVGFWTGARSAWGDMAPSEEFEVL